MRRAAWRGDAAGMHTGKSVVRCLCSVIDFPLVHSQLLESLTPQPHLIM